MNDEWYRSITTAFGKEVAQMMVNWRCQPGKLGIALYFVLSAATLSGSSGSVLAQIIPDQTLGTESSVVTPLNGQSERIEGGASRGSNLFHSFREFNIGEGRGAYFANPAAIENIFSRVTGSNPSHLLGTLGVLGNANLFFLNPNGIIFGPNARLDIRGSLVTSTANSLLFPDGNQFSATNPQAPPLLTIDVPVTIGLQFEGDESAAIINAGELEVGANLTLVGGTVASTGQLLAPEGEVAVSTVSGVEADGSMAEVQLGEAGQILGQEIQPLAGGSNQTETSALSWSELVVDGGEQTGLTVNGEGKVELTQSDTIVSPGDIAIDQLIAQGAKLSANNNLTLVESQLGTFGDLTLLAQDTVRVRDSVDHPFIAAAGGKLLVQGDRGVDIFALNHPDSGLFSGGDLVLLSANPVAGDAYYWSGGNFRIEQLDGSLGDLFSSNDPIIRSQGDVSFDIYQGTSLHILAGGSVDIGTAIITEPETGTVESDFIEENVQLSDGTEISINGSVQPTLDIRAGMTAEAVGSPDITGFDIFPIDFFTDPTFSFLELPPDVTTSATSADITIGDVFINAPNGLVFLTNQYQPNSSLKGGDITITGAGLFGDGIDTRGFGGDGGNVILNASRNITLAGSFIDTRAEGNGGDINLIAKGDITLTNGTLLRSSTAGQGNAGRINITSGDSVVFKGEGTRISSNVTTGAEGNSGDILIDTGSLSITDGARLSVTTFGEGMGGSVKINTRDKVVLDGFRSVIFSEVGKDAVGNSGGIEITTGSLEVINGARLSANTSGLGDAGSVKINAREDVLLAGFSDVTSRVEEKGVGNSGGIEITTGSLEVKNGTRLSVSTVGEGNAGAIKITASENIVLDGASRLASQVASSKAQSNSKGIEINTGSLEVAGGAQLDVSTFGRGDAGSVTINAKNSVIFDGESNNGLISAAFSRVNDGAVGNVGGIEINTGSLDITGGAQLSASTFGQGDAGAVRINARDKVLFSGESNNKDPSAAFSQVQVEGKGKAGGIEITTGFLEVTEGAVLNSSTVGHGNAGAVRINAREKVVLDGERSDGSPSAVASRVRRGAVGNSGGIEINTGSLKVTNGAQLSTTTRGMGNAGSVTINASEKVVFDGQRRNGTPSSAFSQVQATAVGNSGGIEITTGSLEVTNGAVFSTDTFGRGNTGPVKISASEKVLLDGERSGSLPSTVASIVGFMAEGDSEGIEIATDSISITNGAQLTTSTEGKGNAGRVKIIADNNVFFDGENSTGAPSAAFSQVLPTAEGNSKGIELRTGSLSVTNGASLFTRTFGRGNAGNVTITGRNSVIFDGKRSNGRPSGADSQVRQGAFGNAGNIEITTPLLSVTDGALLSARTSGQGIAGTIKVTANTFEANGGGQIRTTTEGSFDAGKIILEVENSITLAGDNSGLFADTNLNSTGDGGNIFIDPRTVIIQDGARVAVNSQGQGKGGDIDIFSGSLTLDRGQISADTASTVEIGGNINIFSGSLTLDNEAAISAITESTDGGNITLQIENDPLLLRRESSISTDAGTAQAGGDGGNITINAPFILAFPSENSDITANAFRGDGGRIEIDTNAIFGIEFRDRTTDLSDFTVSSTFGAPGVFVLDDSGIDPTRGLITLPEETVNTEISQGCQTVRGREAVEYFDIGRGGVLPTPYDPLNADEAIEDWIPLEPKSENGPDSGTTIHSPYPAKTQLILSCPAQ